MGLSSIPTPLEGMFFVILANTAFPMSIFYGLVGLILRVIRFGVSSAASSSAYVSVGESNENMTESIDFHVLSYECYVEEFCRRTLAIRFDALCCYEQSECPVCLTEFKPDSKINRLCCGHIFHKVCLDKWLDYWNLTCPLCRTPLLPEE